MIFSRLDLHRGAGEVTVPDLKVLRASVSYNDSYIMLVFIKYQIYSID
jgi:hypothetical protein